MTPAELDAIRARREDFRTPYSVSVKDIDALLVYVDELERQLSELTREVEEKTRRLIELERPVSAPPGLDRRTSARPPAWGETQMQDGDHLAEAGIASEENLPGLTDQERSDFLGGAA